MKTEEERNTLKEELEAVKRKLAELTDDELEQVSGGGFPPEPGPTPSPAPPR